MLAAARSQASQAPKARYHGQLPSADRLSTGSKARAMWTLVTIAAVVLMAFGLFAWRNVRQAVLKDEERLRL